MSWESTCALLYPPFINGIRISFGFFVFFFFVFFFMVGRGRKGVSLFVQVYTPLTYQVQLNEMKINFLGN
jgi:hypothetical protein